MNTSIRNMLGAGGAILALSLSYASFQFVSSFAKSIQPSSFRSFSVSGEGEVTAIPDVAQFTFSVVTQGGTDVAELQVQNTERMNGAIAFVKSKGVDAKDIKTTSYQIDPRYEYHSCPQGGGTCPPPEIVGYTVTQSVLVKIRDFKVIGDILAGVVESGANTVTQLTFAIDDPTKVQNEARAEAIAKAKEKARMIARAGGFSLGRLLSIEEGGSGWQPYYAKEMSMMGGIGGGAPAPTIEPGSQDVTVTVTLRYEIE